MHIQGTLIEDTYAEAFTGHFARVVITADSARWALEAAAAMTGFATSIIGCQVEAALERELSPAETPDRRPGASALLMTLPRGDLERRLIERIGQAVLTCPTTACFDGLPDAADRLSVGRAIRHFGDGYQSSKIVGGRRFWRIPVMEGEFLVEDTFGRVTGVGGGNFLILAEDGAAGLAAAERAVRQMVPAEGVILPFPGGICRAGSKVGARRSSAMIASTNERYCPTLRAMVPTALPEGVSAVFEIVANGLDPERLRAALRRGVIAACGPGVLAISAGNYGGALGRHRLPLREIAVQPS